MILPLLVASPALTDHVSRSVRLLWGNKLVAGLGSHWAGVRGNFGSIQFPCHFDSTMQDQEF
jgi:hypothetical protein